MSTEGNKDIVRHWVEELDKGNLAVVDEIVANTLVHHDPANPSVTSREEYRQWLAALYSAFPDAHWTIEELTAEGDKAVARLTLRGTHRGEWRGVPPTGRKVAVTMTQTNRIAGGRFVETWVRSDSLDLLQQLGAAPAHR